MSSAHRPTWSAAVGKATLQSKIYSSRDLAAQTRLKFRQPGQGTSTEVKRRDLKLELLQAESESKNRKSQGKNGFQNDAVVKTILAAPVDLDKDDSDDEIIIPSASKGKEVAVAADDDEDDSEEDSDDDEDETAELLKELEKIKKERAQEKEKLEQERAAMDQTTREEEIAMGNPLLNLQSALNVPASPSPSVSSSSSSSFGVKRRWDDDVIFKNQARGTSETPKREFVNDLLRTEFHRRFMKKFIA